MPLRLGSDKLGVGASSSPLMPSDYEVLYKSGRTSSSSPNISSATSSSSLGGFLNKVGSIIPGAGDILGFASNLINNRSNRKLAEMQNRWNLEQWYRENEYNLPKNQLQRYKDAGINPLLAVAGIEPGNAPQLQSAPLANQQSYTDFSGLKQIPEIAIAQEANNISRYNAETQRLDVESNMPIKKQQELNLIEQRKNLEKSTEQIDANIKQIGILCENAKKEGLKLDAEYKYQTLMNSFEEQFGAKTRQAQLSNLLADTRHKNALVREINNNIEMSRKNYSLAVKEFNFNVKDKNRLFEVARVTCNNQAKLIKAELDKMRKEGKLTDAEYKRKALENDNYWNQRFQDFTGTILQMFIFGAMVRGGRYSKPQKPNPVKGFGTGSNDIIQS